MADATTIEEGNDVIAAWLDDVNGRFSRPAASETDFHRPLRPDEHLDEIFAVRTPRTVSADFTVRYDNRILQLVRQAGLPRPREKVTAARRLDGTLAIEFRAKVMRHEDVTEALAAAPKQKPQPKSPRKSTAHKPPHGHPWNNPYWKSHEPPVAARGYGQ